MNSSQGTVAAVAWVIAGALLYNTEPEARLLSWQTPVYFVLGMFVAGALFGNLFSAMVRGITHVVIVTKIVTEPTRKAQIALNVTSYILFALEALLIYLVARWTVRVMF